MKTNRLFPLFPCGWPGAWFGLSLVLAAVFLFAGLSKSFRSAEFERAILAYHVIPVHYAHWGAMTLPWAELLVGIALLRPRSRSLGAATAIALLATFTSVGVLAWMQGFRPACGCFGEILEFGRTIGPAWLGRNLLLMLGAVALFVHCFLTMDRGSDQS